MQSHPSGSSDSEEYVALEAFGFTSEVGTMTKTLRALRAKDPTWTKLKLVSSPCEYYDYDFEELLDAMRLNSVVTQVLLEGRFVQGLTPEQYMALLWTLNSMPALQELEIWSVVVPLSLLCQACPPSLQRLGLGFVGLSHLQDCDIFLDAHPHLETVFLSDFRMETSSSTTNTPPLSYIGPEDALTGVFLQQLRLHRKAVQKKVFQATQKGNSEKTISTFQKTSNPKEDAAKSKRKRAPRSNSLSFGISFSKATSTRKSKPSQQERLHHSWQPNAPEWTNHSAVQSTSQQNNNYHSGEEMTRRPREASREEESSSSSASLDRLFEARESSPSPLLDSFFMALATCPKLIKVELFSSRVDGPAWSSDALAALLTSSSLRHLTLRRLSLQTTEIQGLVDSLQLPFKYPLRVLDLNENRLSDEGCLVLVDVLNTHRSLKELNLRDNEITASGCQSICQALQSQHATLEKLNLGCNRLGDEGAFALADLLDWQSRNNCGALKHLELFRAGITDKGCVRLAQVLENNRNLLTLGLSYNQMTDVSYVAFGSALQLNRTLTALHIQVDRRKITAVGCQALLDMIAENTVLSTLSTLLSACLHGEQSHFSGLINIYLRLNHAGRHELLHGDTTYPKKMWVGAIAQTNDDLNAIYFWLQANPSLCSAVS